MCWNLFALYFSFINLNPNNFVNLIIIGQAVTNPLASLNVHGIKQKRKTTAPNRKVNIIIFESREEDIQVESSKISNLVSLSTTSYWAELDH